MEYIVDNKGIKTSVIIPFSKWEKLNSDFEKLKNKLDVFQSVQEGFAEIKSSKKKNISFQSLKDFVNESNN